MDPRGRGGWGDRWVIWQKANRPTTDTEHLQRGKKLKLKMGLNTALKPGSGGNR